MIILGPEQNREIAKVEPLPKDWTVRCQHKDDRSLIDVMNRFVREHPDLKWYGYLQDDLKFKTRDWDTRLIAAAGNAGIASCNDQWRAPKRNTGASVYGGDLMRAWGFWGPPKLQHTYIDDFWEESGRECNNWTVLMDVITPHQHFANGKNKQPMDATYKFSYAPGAQDQAEWYRFRKSKDYADLLARVKSLKTVNA
ncbi:MAG TPA: hypothetical protein VFK30_10570 [Anaerolineae bacterium]|nr:hypothetical protein [Anaerolineae bacterium]